jgi:hypothetical protein
MEHTEQKINTRIQAELGKNKIARLFEAAEKFGVIHRGWTCIDYMRYAIMRHGWESTCVGGMKGSFKSNLMMQHGQTLYGDIDKAREHMVTIRPQLMKHMRYAIDNDITIPWEACDDIVTLFPKSLYFTDRKMYSKLQSGWEASRTVFSCFEFSCVQKNKVAGFILEDITGDIKCYNPIFITHEDGSMTPIKGHYDYRRWMWTRNFKDPTMDIPKLIAIEDIPFPVTPDAFKIDPQLREGIFISSGVAYKGEEFFKQHAGLTGIDTPKFRTYWQDRLKITRNAFESFEEVLDDINHRIGKRNQHLPKEEETQQTQNMQNADKNQAALAMLEARKKKLGW